jgi:hypothetical protein
MQIPETHPRLWFNAERLAAARSYYAEHPFTPEATDYVGQAYRYLMTGETNYGRTAVNWAAGLTMNVSGTSSNDARWYGESAILVYDWCYDQWTAAERSAFIARWNGYLEALRTKSWGGLEMPLNNYFWGYLRNEMLWGIASYHENTSAGTFLDWALATRFQGSFVPAAAGGAKGGVAQEGTQYGRYLLGYSAVPMRTASLLGRGVMNETNFFKEAVFYLIYATTPAVTTQRGSATAQYELFPLNDDQYWRYGGSANSADYGNFMLGAAQQWAGTAVSEYARRWLSQTGTAPSVFARASDTGGSERDFGSLPLDYYAPGPQYLYGRNAWGPAATTFMVGMGPLTGTGHGHQDFGSWQMWRNGRWLSRETVAYSDTLTGYAGTSTVGGGAAALHNVILMNGVGQATEPVNGPAVVTRLESRADYSYLAANLTPAYRNNQVAYARADRDNPVVANVVREYLFLRPLETLVVLDRLESNSEVMAAANVVKTFVAHFEQSPVVEDGNHVLAVNGDQAVRLTTLVPAAPSYRVVNEGGSIGQYRLEVETSGAAQSYFLHVLQGRGTSEGNLTTAVSESASAYTVTLSLAGKGYCRVVFEKGMSSSGGGVACSTTALPAGVQPFLSRVQGISVGDSGPVWESLGGGGTTDTTAPVITGVTATAGTSTATISWGTNEAATGQVEYGPTSGYGQVSALEGSYATTHTAVLSGLTAGTGYHYRVLSRDAAGNLATSADQSFTTTTATVQHTIVATAGANGTITPSGTVTVAAGGSQSFAITPATGYRVAEVLVDGESVGAVTSYTFSSVAASHTLSASFEPIPSSGGGAADSVTITVHAYAGGDGPANLVSNALPLKPGQLFSAAQVRVLDAGVEVPIAARVLATWPQDNSIRSLLLQFSAPFTTASKSYTVELGVGRTTTDRAFTTVSWDLPARIFTLPAAWLSESLVFWEQKPLGQAEFAAWENKLLSYYSRIETVGTAACVRDDQYYDTISTTYQLYARTGQLNYLVNARRWALHHRRDQIYLEGVNIGHPRCSGSYLNNTRYTFPEGLVSDYFMFGDEEARRVSGLVVDNFYMPHADGYYYMAPNTRGWWTEREPAFALIGLLAQYEATGNATYLNRVRERVGQLRQMQVDNGNRAWVHNLYDHDPSEGCATTDYGSSPWMSGLLLEAIIKYHKLTGDVAARESILMAVEDLRARDLATGSYAGNSFRYLGCPAYRDGTPDLDNLIAHAYGYAYLLTGTQEYLTLGRRVFDTAVANGYAGAAKQYNQQFRSSGRFVAYALSTPTGTPSPDTTAPAVALSAPAAGQTVTGTITATATATDAVGVVGVQFLVDGVATGSEDTASPYSVSIDTTTLSNGVHSIAARARDAAGNAATSTAVSVTVNNADTTAPTVSVTSPAAGQTVTGTITATATATDAVGVVGVQFLVDGAASGSEDTTSPYSASIDTTTLSNGTHTIAARARDAAGNTRTSTAVSVTVNNADTTAPTVAITSPTAGQTVSGTITATATATDAVGVVGVQFLVDGAASGSEDTASPYSVSINTTTLSNGTHTIAARARDAAGNTTTSTAVSVTVNNADTTAPTVSMTSPAAGQTVSGTITATATATDAVGVVGVQFLVDGVASGSEDTTSPYSVSINTTTLSNGPHTIAARARDAAGNTRTSTAVSVTVSNSTSTTFTPIRVNSGGPAHTDPTGIAWVADTGYAGGYAESVSASISNTATPVLYQSARVAKTLQYSFTVPNGTYTVTLKFSENYFKAAGKRRFNISLNGAVVQTGFDIFASSGARYRATDRTFTTAVTGGQLQILLAATTDNAQVNAIEIKKVQ